MGPQLPAQRTALPRSHPARTEEEPSGSFEVIEQIWLIRISIQNQTLRASFSKPGCFIFTDDGMKQGCRGTEVQTSGLDSTKPKHQEESPLEGNDTRGHKKHGPRQTPAHSFLEVRAPE